MCEGGWRAKWQFSCRSGSEIMIKSRHYLSKLGFFFNYLNRSGKSKLISFLIDPGRVGNVVTSHQKPQSSSPAHTGKHSLRNTISIQVPAPPTSRKMFMLERRWDSFCSIVIVMQDYVLWNKWLPVPCINLNEGDISLLSSKVLPLYCRKVSTPSVSSSPSWQGPWQDPWPNPPLLLWTGPK